jgi:hypothetical protein
MNFYAIVMVLSLISISHSKGLATCPQNLWITLWETRVLTTLGDVL